MSLFDWFTHSPKTTKKAAASQRSGMGHVAATAPSMHSGKTRGKMVPAFVGHDANHKTERLERREQLYRVVRDSMIRAGVLAASYKFKVLSLDAHGLQYLIMMDLSNQIESDTARLIEIENMIAQAAKARHDMTVSAVYWRVNVQNTVVQPQSDITPVTPRPRKATELQAPHSPATPKLPAIQHTTYEPLQDDEVAAFKRALASVTPAAAHGTPGQVVTSGRRNPAPPVEFEDTQMVPPDEHASPLSVTQYGDLN